MASTTSKTDDGPTLKKADAAQSKIALPAIEQVESVPKKSGRRSATRDLAEQLMLPENAGKSFKVGHGKLTNAYQLRKRLSEILPATFITDVRPLGDNTGDVYTVTPALADDSE